MKSEKRELESHMKKLNCTPTHLSVFFGTNPDLRTQLLNQDLIYVSGGNTRNMLTLWKDWGIDLLMRETYDHGIVLAGWSAGSICWFEEGVTDSIPGSLTAMKCLGFLKGSNFPHYDGEPERRPSYHRLLTERKIGPGVAADDRMALHYIDGKLEKTFSSLSTAKAYTLELKNNEKGSQVIETPIV